MDDTSRVSQADGLADGFGSNLLLLSLLNPVPVPPPVAADRLDRQQIAELTIAELTLTIQSLREELVNAYQEIINTRQLVEDLETSYASDGPLEG